MQRSYDHPLNIITNVIGNIDNLESLFLKSIIVHNATFEWVLHYTFCHYFEIMFIEWRQISNYILSCWSTKYIRKCLHLDRSYNIVKSDRWNKNEDGWKTDKDTRKQGVHCCYMWTSIFEMSMNEK